jgi:hypothetical protein
MMTPLDAVEWCFYMKDALMARWWVDTLWKAKTAQFKPQG